MYHQPLYRAQFFVFIGFLIVPWQICCLQFDLLNFIYSIASKKKKITITLVTFLFLTVLYSLLILLAWIHFMEFGDCGFHLTRIQGLNHRIWFLIMWILKMYLLRRTHTFLIWAEYFHGSSLMTIENRTYKNLTIIFQIFF